MPTTQPQSTTPRTDAAEQEFIKTHGLSGFGIASLARTLETELNQVNNQVASLQARIEQLQGLFDHERDTLKLRAEAAEKDKERLQEALKDIMGGYNPENSLQVLERRRFIKAQAIHSVRREFQVIDSAMSATIKQGGKKDE